MTTMARFSEPRRLVVVGGIEAFPKNFLIRSDEAVGMPLAHAVQKFNPSLVIIDTLRPFRPDAR